MAWIRQYAFDGESGGGTREYYVNTESGATSDTPPGGYNDVYNMDPATLQQLWQSTQGSLDQKISSIVNQTGMSPTQVMPQLVQMGLASTADLQQTSTAKALEQAGYPMSADGQFIDNNSMAPDWFQNLLENTAKGGALALTGAGVYSGLAGAGAGAAGTAAAGADVASAAGAMGGAAGTAGGGLTAFEAGGGLAGLSGAGGATAGLGSLSSGAGGAGPLVDSGNPYGGTMWPDDSVMNGDPYGGTMWPDDSVPGTSMPQNNNGTSWSQFGNWAMQNLAPNAMGPNWGDVGLGLMQYQGQRKFQDDIINTMNRAVDRADPFYGERPFYQNQFKQMNTDPNYFQNDAALNAMQNSSMRGVAAQDVSKGYLGSGNILHDLHRTGTETAANYILPRMDMSAKAAGAYNDPARAGQIMSQMGPMAAGAGLAQNQTLGSTFRMAGTGAQQGTLSNPIPSLANWASKQNWSL